MNIPLTLPELATHTLTCPDPLVLKRQATLTKGKNKAITTSTTLTRAPTGNEIKT